MDWPVHEYDRRHSVYFTYQAPIGPHRRVSFITFQGKAYADVPGWYLIHVHGDYFHSRDVSSTNVLDTIRLILEEWRDEVVARFPNTNGANKKA